MWSPKSFLIAEKLSSEYNKGIQAPKILLIIKHMVHLIISVHHEKMMAVKILSFHTENYNNCVY